MAGDESFVEFIVEQLRALPDVRARRMFGAYGLYSKDDFFAIVDDGRLYFKTGPATIGRYVRAGMGVFEYAPGKRLKSYYEVPVDVFEDDDALAEWAREAIGVARSAPRKKKKRRRG